MLVIRLDMRISLVVTTVLKRLQRLVRSYRLLPLLVAAVVILHLVTTQLYVERSVGDHSPGRLGESLVARHRNVTQSHEASSWQLEFQLEFLRDQDDDNLFAWPDRNDRCEDLEAPAEFERGENDSRACLRLKLLKELDSWTPHKSFR